MGLSNDARELYKHEEITRSNTLISAKYKSTLTENKIMVLALKKAKRDEFGRPTITFSTAEIKRVMGRDDGSFYTQLKSVAKAMTGRTMFIEDKEKHSFKFINIIHTAEFENGKFTVNFTPEMNYYLDDLKSNFTTMNMGILVDFTSNYAYRIYELLKTQAYRVEKDNEPLKIDYNLSELKLAIGCVNTQEERVQKELDKPNPDFDYIVNSVAKEKHFEKWYDFKVNVLEVAKRQINEKSDLEIDYEPLRSGRGGKVVGITFYIKKNENYKEIEEKTEQENEILLENGTSVVDTSDNVPQDYEDRFAEIMDYIEKKVSSKDIKAFLKIADYDVERVKAAYDLSKKQTEIRNFVGWMKKAIEEGYTDENIHLIDDSEEKAQKADIILEDYKKEKESGNLAERTWNRIKKRDEYQEFIGYLLDQEGMTEETLEIAYSPRECMELYQNWKMKSK
ncbi:MAG: replication initiation protein [Lachnospiraceae bacterium]|uniref:replication initiation protein n=1 Tax=Roseburia hominis TaxID=301301 RepID=UPI001F15DA66|nr:replication initiation protein [Roseburia hominis]MCI5713847.1 replication initiation protein [Lachnospiraceae bacterium]MDD6168791.1 replication initiation protein [Lachnospiraceae bacterium]MDY4838983.1 replication initiation protein [Lachnospiraceae bacterium]